MFIVRIVDKYDVSRTFMMESIEAAMKKLEEEYPGYKSFTAINAKIDPYPTRRKP